MLSQQGAAAARRAGDHRKESRLDINIGFVYIQRGRYAQACATFEAGLALAEARMMVVHPFKVRRRPPANGKAATLPVWRQRFTHLSIVDSLTSKVAAISGRDCCPASTAAMTRSRKSCEWAFMLLSVNNSRRKSNRNLL